MFEVVKVRKQTDAQSWGQCNAIVDQSDDECSQCGNERYKQNRRE